MKEQSPKPLRNVRFLQVLCIVFPAAAMAAAHWFPWRRLLGRDLHRLEAYMVGTTTIVGTALTAIAQSDAGAPRARNDHATMLLFAAGAAGAATAGAYAIDEIIGLRADLAAQRAHGEALNGHGPKSG